MRLHDIIDQIPISFSKRYEETKDCWCIQKENIVYQLTIEIEQRNTQRGKCRLYRIFYFPRYYGIYKKKPPIIWDQFEQWMECKRYNNFEENLKLLKNELQKNWIVYENFDLLNSN